MKGMDELLDETMLRSGRVYLMNAGVSWEVVKVLSLNLRYADVKFLRPGFGYVIVFYADIHSRAVLFKKATDVARVLYE